MTLGTSRDSEEAGRGRVGRGSACSPCEALSGRVCSAVLLVPGLITASALRNFKMLRVPSPTIVLVAHGKALSYGGKKSLIFLTFRNLLLPWASDWGEDDGPLPRISVFDKAV